MIHIEYKHVLVIGMFSLLLGGCSLPFIGNQYAGLQVEAEPKSEVYIDGKHVGETTYYDKKIKADEHVVRVVPLSGLPPWEVKVKLKSGLLTTMSRTFAATPQESASSILELEKITNKKIAELTIVTTPENVIVRLDDQPKGFSPLTNIGISPEKHKVTLSAPGYKTQNITLTAIAGYRLILQAELGKSLALQPVLPDTPATPSATLEPSPAPTASPSAKPPLASPTPKASASPKPSPITTLTKPYVEILTTPTGWLRVRSEPNGLIDNEVARVNSGDTYPYIESNDTGWHKIEYATGKQGWVAATYAKVVK